MTTISTNPKRRRLWTASVVVFVLAVVLWVVGRYSARSEAIRRAEVAVNALSVADSSDLDVPALRQLQESGHATRRAALELLLSSDEHLPRFANHRQGLIVALSQVRKREAQRLARKVLLPALRAATYPPTLNAAADLLHRWSIAGQLTEEESGQLARDLWARMEAGGDSAFLEPLASVLADLGPTLAPDAAAELLRAVTPRILTEANPAVLAFFLDVALEAGEALDAEQMEPVAGAMEQRFPGADQRTLRVLNGAANRIRGEAFTGAPDLTDLKAELAIGYDVGTLILRLTELALAAPRLEEAESAEIAEIVLNRMAREQDPLMLSVEAAALGLLGDALPEEIAGQARAIALDHIEDGTDVVAVSTAALDLSSLPVAEQESVRAARNLVTRMASERDAYNLSLLVSGLTALADTLPATEKARLAQVLEQPVLLAPDIAAQTRMALGFHEVADGMTEVQARQFAARVLDQMETTRGGATLRLQALLLNAVLPQLPAPDLERDLEQAAEYLVTRAEATRAPATLRELSMGLYAVAAPSGGASGGASGDTPGNASGNDAIQRMVRRLGSTVITEGDLGRRRELIDSLALLAPLASGLDLDGAQDEIKPVLVRELVDERDPLRLRFQAITLAGVPEARLSPSQLRSIDHVFSIPNASCQLALTGLLEDLVAQLQNPACSRDAWELLAGNLLRGGAEVEDEPLSLDALAGVEDDDGETGEGEDEAGIDFAVLSDALDTFRPSATPANTPGTSTLIALLLCAAGLILGFLAFRAGRGDAHSASRPTFG